MAILLDERSRVLVQGITGREGMARTRFMRAYGTQVVAGVTPGRGGTTVGSVPVYNTVKEAVQQHGSFDATVTFVPGLMVKDAVVEAVDAGIRFIAMPVERVPLHDALMLLAYARQRGAKVLGPGSFGLISPGKAVIGWIGGSEDFAKEIFKPGHVGIVSRSGGQTSTFSWAIGQAGLGISTALHIGGEPVVGLSPAEVLPLFEADPDTHAVALFGEIGTVAEEEAAEVIGAGKFTKPLVAYIAGAGVRPGMRFSHASAIVERGRGTAENKIKVLRQVGAHVVDQPEDLARTLAEIVRKS
ncbi:MAG: succinate--CoA ligase subunit alpha [Planctomycetales bacterium]|nr:succinate--CoA ligase subunit alpha [Planctomycetales bacterium]